MTQPPPPPPPGPGEPHTEAIVAPTTTQGATAASAATPPTTRQPAVTPPGWSPPGGAAPAPTGETEHVRPTGPVPVPPPAGAALGEPARPRHRPGLGAGGAALVLAALALVLLEVGLLLSPGGAGRLWSLVPTWSAFATVAVLLLGAPLLAGTAAGRGLTTRTAWQVAAGGTAGLAAFWVLLVLPGVATDRGFVLTAALALAGGSLWLSPGRSA